MNKKGFTLIELLAVIVILAIIALIATPIVLNIISDTGEQADLRSADFYLDAVELSIAQSTLEGQNITDGTYNILGNGNICLEEYDSTNKKCTDGNDSDTDVEELKVEVKGKTPKEGTITIKNGQIDGISFVLNTKEITKNSKGELVYVKTLDEVCEYKEGTKETISSKYECKVDPNREPYTFYILSYLDENGNITTTKENVKSVNLIMDSNIRTGGEPVKELNPTEEQEGTVAWINAEDYGSSSVKTDKGPITAMNYLAEATKNWTNVNELIISTFDCWEGNDGCTNYQMAKTYNAYARMPQKCEVDLFDTMNKSNTYLYEYLDSEMWNNRHSSISINHANGISGYWTSSLASDSYAWAATADGFEYDGPPTSPYGVRPVISLKLN